MTDNLNLAEWVSAAFTAVIAVATISYVVYTRRLWHETRASADAAKAAADATRIAADAAKQAADMAAERERPILGILEVELVQLPVTPLSEVRQVAPGPRQIIVTLRNYGALGAKRVALDWKSYFQAENETRNNGNQGPIDIAPNASCPITLSVLVKPNDSERTASNGGNYKIEIQAAYFSPNGQCRWKYRAVRALTPPFTFAMDPQVPDREERLK